MTLTLEPKDNIQSPRRQLGCSYYGVQIVCAAPLHRSCYVWPSYIEKRIGARK
jgi:hypothetical protein